MKSISNKYIWFAKPETLNDPHDMKIEIKSLFQIDKLSSGSIIEDVQFALSIEQLKKITRT